MFAKLLLLCLTAALSACSYFVEPPADMVAKDCPRSSHAKHGKPDRFAQGAGIPALPPSLDEPAQEEPKNEFRTPSANVSYGAPN